MTSPPAEPPGARDCGGAARTAPLPPSGQPRVGVPPVAPRTRWPGRVVPLAPAARGLPGALPARGSAGPGLRGGGASATVNRTWLVFKPFPG